MLTSRALVITAAATALVTSLALSATASSGGWLRLGSHNDTSRVTALTNHGHGPALQLITRRGSPPFGVTSHRRVAHLNADRVDGLHARQLRTKAYVYRIGGDDDAGPWVIKSFPGLPAGYYLATYRVVASFDSPAPYDLSCWFTTRTQPKAGPDSAHQTDPLMTIAGSAYVDGRHPFTFRINGASNYSIRADSTYDRLDSRITFIRVAPIRTATTRYVP